MDDALEDILFLVDKYMTEKHQSKHWTAGKDWVQYSGPYYNSEEYVAAVKTLLKEWLVLGEDCIKFENEFPKLMGNSFGVLTNSGSSSNLLMMAALTSKRSYNFPKGTKVLVPVAGFPTTINPILQVGFRPVFVDIEIDTLNLDLDRVESILIQNPDIKIITFAHVLGNPPNMERLIKIIHEYGLVFLEDCCDALGTTFDGKLLGSFGFMSSCSFYPAHHLTMGEGGFVSTPDLSLEVILRCFRDWGRGCHCSGKKQNLSNKGICGNRFSKWIKGFDHVFDHKYIFDEIGYNLKPIELQASMGLVQMKKFPEISLKRKENYKHLLNVFSKYEKYFHLPIPTYKADVNWFAFPLTVRDGAPFTKSKLCEFLEENKIQTRNYFAGNILLQPAYNHMMDTKEAIETYPMATKAMTDTFFLGTSPVLDLKKVDYIQEIVVRFMDKL